MMRKLTDTVTCPVSTSTLHSDWSVSLRRAKAMASATAAPVAPASVAVKKPAYRPPSTAAISSTLGSSLSSSVPAGISASCATGCGTPLSYTERGHSVAMSTMPTE